MTNRKSALIIKLGAIGDVAMAIPAVAKLHDQGFQIDWVCGNAALSLLRCYSWINVIPVDDRAILSGSFLKRVKSILQLWSTLCRRRYDVCATLFFDPRYSILSLPVRARRKFILSRHSRDQMIIPGRSHTNEVARILLDLPDSCNADSLQPVRPDRLPSTPVEFRKKPVCVALVPAGASNMLHQQTLRRWPIALYTDLASLLLSRGWQVCLVGGPDDAWVRPFFEDLDITDQIGKFSLPQVIQAFDSCDVVVSHDTGPLHLAGMSYAALIGLFGPTNPGSFLPKRDFVTGIWGGINFACRPCYDSHNFAPCSDNGCMQQISPQRVLREIDLLLERKACKAPTPSHVLMV